MINKDAGCKPLRALILGYGIRGRVYASYAASHPDRYSIVGIADPAFGQGETLNVPCWSDWKEALASGVEADVAVIALPDALHCKACLPALEKGLHVLLEKPVGCNLEECMAIRDAQRKAKRLVLTGYVLRYSPYYRKLNELVHSGEIGEIVSIHHLVAVSYGKAAHSYCRGNWSVESNGTGMLVNKCIHDMDLVCSWMKGRNCINVSSFGSLSQWRPDNRPAGAADRCCDCPANVSNACPFDAYKLYLKRPDLRYHFPDASDEAMKLVVEASRYGRCVYACGNDSVDHQTVMMQFESGSTVTLEMESFSKRRGRITRFFGAKGEMLADGEKIVIMPFDGDDHAIIPMQTGHHGGGDREIMTEFAKIVNHGSPVEWNRIIDDALQSHRIAFMAEASRKGERVMVIRNNERGAYETF